MKDDRLESPLLNKKCANLQKPFWEKREEEEIGAWAHRWKKKCEVPSHMSNFENICLSRGVTTWVPHLYSGHSTRQAQDCHLKPGQGEPWVVLGTPGVGLGKPGRIYIVRFGCGKE